MSPNPAQSTLQSSPTSGITPPTGNHRGWGSGGVRPRSASLPRVGRNAAASWTQTGDLVGRTGKTPTAVEPRFVAVAYMRSTCGRLEGLAGQVAVRLRLVAVVVEGVS